MSFPRYQKYKASGVEWLGDVPEHWATQRLGFYFRERREKVSDKDFEPLSVTMQGIVPRIDTAAKSDDGENRKKVCVGDFIINSRSDRKGSAGVSTLSGSVSLISTVLEPQEAVVGPYIHHLLRSVDFQEEYFRYGKGIVADLWSTNFSEMRNILLAMPPIPEQTQIVAFLDRETAKIDALLGEQQRLIGLLKEKRQAVISHAVTKGLNPDAPMKPSGIEWLGDVPAHCRIPPLYLRYEVVLGKMLNEKRLTRTNLVPYLRNVDVQWDRVNIDDLPEMDVAPDEFERFTLKRGDLLVCEGGEVGRTATWNGGLGRCAFQKAIHRLRPQSDGENPRFLYYCMLFAASAGVFVAEGNPNTISHLTGEKLRRYRFPSPPLPEQTAVASFLDRETATIDALIAEAQRAIDLLQERRTVLISAAVTGQIDLRPASERTAA